MKMQLTRACIMAIVLLATTQVTLTAPAADSSLTSQDSREPAELNPINAEEVVGDDLERNKRKLPDATFEAKNAVLGFVFGPKRRRARGGDPNDAEELDRNKVSFQIPGELFSKAFSTVTNVSQSFGRLMMNTARRYARFALFFKPIFGDALVVQGYQDPTTTTSTTTARTTTEESDRVNEI